MLIEEMKKVEGAILETWAMVTCIKMINSMDVSAGVLVSTEGGDVNLFTLNIG